MNAKQQAIADIKADLQAEGRCFLAFRNELNKSIRAIVKEHIRQQKNLNKVFVN